MISKQDWFEQNIVIHNVDDFVRAQVSPTMTVLWEKWREVRLFCIDLAIEELPPKQKRVIKDSFYTKLTPEQIAKKMRVKKYEISKIKRRATNNLKKNILIKFFLHTAGEEKKPI